MNEEKEFIWLLSNFCKADIAKAFCIMRAREKDARRLVIDLEDDLEEVTLSLGLTPHACSQRDILKRIESMKREIAGKPESQVDEILQGKEGSSLGGLAEASEDADR